MFRKLNLLYRYPLTAFFMILISPAYFAILAKQSSVLIHKIKRAPFFS